MRRRSKRYLVGLITQSWLFTPTPNGANLLEMPMAAFSVQTI